MSTKTVFRVDVQRGLELADQFPWLEGVTRDGLEFVHGCCHRCETIVEMVTCPPRTNPNWVSERIVELVQRQVQLGLAVFLVGF